MERLTDDQRDFVESHLGLAGFFAKKATPGRCSDDGSQDGVFGLARAVQLYDPDRGLKFSTYAARWVRQAIQRARQEDATIRVPHYLHAANPHRATHKAAADRARNVANFGDMAGSDVAAKPDEPEWDDEDFERARRLLSTLPARTREIIRRRLDGETFKAIGASLGLSREQVATIELRGLATLRKAWDAEDRMACYHHHQEA